LLFSLGQLLVAQRMIAIISASSKQMIPNTNAGLLVFIDHFFYIVGLLVKLI